MKMAWNARVLRMFSSFASPWMLRATTRRRRRDKGVEHLELVTRFHLFK